MELGAGFCSAARGLGLYKELEIEAWKSET